MRNPYSVVTLLIAYVVILSVAFFFYPKWEKERTEATISWDVSGYYMYLPALFIYKDIAHCSFQDSVLKKYTPTPNFQQAFVHEPSGNYVMKYSGGQALAMLPFFLLAHTYCNLQDHYPADGFSYPYQWSIGVGMLFYSLLGLWFLRIFLLKYFRDATVAWIIGCYVIGTNYLNFVAIDHALTHNVLFTFYTLLLLTTWHYYTHPTFPKAILIGCLVGWATWIRPTDAISLLIPLLWGVNSWKDIPNQLRFFGKYRSHGFALLFFMALPFMLQMLYWHTVTGEWLVYSYKDQGFSWLHPHVLNFTFSYRCGWLRYSPMLLLPLLGCLLYVYKGKHKVAVLGFLAINFYIVSAWDIWDYGGSSGRAMVQSYAVFAMPFALLFETIWKKKWLRFIWITLVFICAYLNIWWTYHAHAGNIQMYDVTEAYYWKMVGRWNGQNEYKKLLDQSDMFEGTPRSLDTVYVNSFSTDRTTNSFDTLNNRWLRINENHPESAAYPFPFSPKIKDWIRAEATFYCVTQEWDIWRQILFQINFKQGETVVQSNFVRPQRFLYTGEKKRIFFDAKCPKESWDHAEIRFIAYVPPKELHVDDLTVISFKEN